MQQYTPVHTRTLYGVTFTRDTLYMIDLWFNVINFRDTDNIYLYIYIYIYIYICVCVCMRVHLNMYICVNIIFELNIYTSIINFSLIYKSQYID